MAKPTILATIALKRLCRYLRSRQRLVLRYDYQRPTHIDTYSNTDHAGCARTRKSTSGGCVMVGRHIIKTWSATQACVAPSSGEAEFYGLVRVSGIALGHKPLLEDSAYEYRPESGQSPRPRWGSAGDRAWESCAT